MKTSNILALALGSILIMTSFISNGPVASYSIDTEDSKVRWTGYHLAKSYSHYGWVDIKSGSLNVENGDLISGVVTMDMTTLSNADLESKDNKKLVGHLKSKDFFAVKDFPEASLHIRKTTRTGSNYKVEGDITIRGITEQIEFDAMKIAANDEMVSFKAAIKVDRTKHKVLYGWSVGNAIISDTFDLEVDLIARK